LSDAAPTRLQPIRTLDAGMLSVAHLEMGPADGPAVVPLHGFAYEN
jgi:hypothetical protein